ncbi:PREDICTED: transferrin receptor protein 1-like [Cyprinodon variegatus]|uniref:Transferrin receptor 1b n=1 Tax=Cyprinodon variegatus TaxID=28743 RepID=A0A3Q2D7J3_CYPVA|nr:PREDICTED: transferrin receptor protein 1-like [Cyprinodon variegatus]
MERIRSAFQSMMKSERYSRFTLQPSENSERHTEVNLSDYAVDDGAEAPGSPSFRPAPPRNSRRTVALMIVGFLMIFVAGYLVGFISHHKPKVEPDCGQGMKSETTTPAKAAPTQAVPPPEASLSWNDLTRLLKGKLSSNNFEQTLKKFDEPTRSAGSDQDMKLANGIFSTFQTLGMHPWTDIHYVQLQMPNSEMPNTVYFGSDVFKPKGYLAYSKPGRVEGPLVYGNYGRQEDLDFVQRKVNLKGSVLLLRAGKITLAQQVDNAARMGASAVLIYLDTEDYNVVTETELYGHVHLGSGDPYTPGFPSFNHTQFAPTESAGLPEIPAQTITANSAAALLKKIGGPDGGSDFRGELKSVAYNLGGTQNITVEVNNVLVNKEIHNVFGVIKGFTDPDRYVVLGAQRDAWGAGYTKATVGTSVLIELAKTFHEMVEKDGFRPKRSIIFASWSAGEFGSVGATEWLEGYMSSIDQNVVTYINLDGVVMGRESFIASASPLLYSLMESTMKEVKMPQKVSSIYNEMGAQKWETEVLRPMSMEDPAYPFLAFAGIPSISFHFISKDFKTASYPYYGTALDNMDHLNYKTNHRTSNVTAAAAQFAGLMTLRLVHDHLLHLDVGRYYGPITKSVLQIYKQVNQLTQAGKLKDVSPSWLNRARGAYKRAADDIANAISNTDMTDNEAARILNDRIMRVEHSLLSPYVSVVETPFRHLIFGHGSHTLASIAEAKDPELLQTQLALATWNLQGCANAMVGNVWDIDDEI